VRHVYADKSFLKGPETGPELSILNQYSAALFSIAVDRRFSKQGDSASIRFYQHCAWWGALPSSLQVFSKEAYKCLRQLKHAMG
jgi:hypothetical protein